MLRSVDLFLLQSRAAARRRVGGGREGKGGRKLPAFFIALYDSPDSSFGLYLPPPSIQVSPAPSVAAR